MIGPVRKIRNPQTKTDYFGLTFRVQYRKGDFTPDEVAKMESTLQASLGRAIELVRTGNDYFGFVLREPQTTKDVHDALGLRYMLKTDNRKGFFALRCAKWIWPPTHRAP